MANVLKLDCATNTASMERDLGADYAEVWVDIDWACNATYLTALHAASILQEYWQFYENGYGSLQETVIAPNAGTPAWTGYPAAPASPFVPAAPVTSMQFYRARIHLAAGSPITTTVSVDGVDIGSFVTTGVNLANIRYLDVVALGMSVPGGFVYMDNLKVGTTAGGTDIYSDGFETDLSGFNFVSAAMSIIADPGIAPPVAPTPAAAFTVSRSDGSAPLGVDFTDTSTGGPSSWMWDFGDGHTSEEQHPSHVFRAAGSFDVSLTVE